MLNLKEIKLEQRENIKEIVQSLTDKHMFIDSAQTVKKILKEDHDINAKAQAVRNIMSQDLDMRYRKVVPVSLHSNTPKNLIMRQRFAMKYLEILKSKKTILNIDETWLGMSDFRRMKWRPAGSTNSIAKL